VYKAGFATTQAAYEAAVKPVFQSLDRLEQLLEGKEYLIGNRLTEADVRLYTTIVLLVLVLHRVMSLNAALRFDLTRCTTPTSNAT